MYMHAHTDVVILYLGMFNVNYDRCSMFAARAGEIRLVPGRAPPLGGIYISVYGPRFKSTAHCRFDNIVVKGIVSKKKTKAYCVVPMFARVGVIPVSVSVDGGRTFSPAVDFHLGENARS